MEPIKDATKRKQKGLNKPWFFLIAAAVGLIIAGLVFLSYQNNYDIVHTNEKVLILGALANCFFISGVIVGGFGALILISGEGFFDIIAYGTKKVVSYIFVSKERRNNEQYIDYKLRKEAEREGGRIWFIAFVGGIFLVISFLFSIPFINPSSKRIADGGNRTVEILQEEYIEDISVDQIEFIYMKYSANYPEYGGTLSYKITYHTTTDSALLAYYILYIDSDVINKITEVTYNNLFDDYMTSDSTHGTIKG